MQTVHSVIKHGAFYWDHELVPLAVLEARLEKVRAAIRAAGDAAWLFYGDARSCGALAYVSHYFPRLRDAVLLVALDAPPVLFVNGAPRMVPSMKPLTWIADVRGFGRPPKPLAALLTETNLAGARVGTVGVAESFPALEWNELGALVPGIAFAERDAEFAQLRREKDAVDLGVSAKATGILAEAFAVAGTLLQPGASTGAAFAAIERVLRLAGAEDVRILTGGGADGTDLAPPVERVLAAGESIMLFLGVEMQRYWAEGMRTFAIGAGNPQADALAARAQAAVDAMAAAAVTGVRGSVLAAAAQTALADDALLAAASAYGLGHGIGLDVHEWPSIAAGSRDVLTPGTALALHVVLKNGSAGAGAGRTVVVR
jgi:Xaa-Pro aminopeptidase